MPQTTVLIPTHNRAEILRQTLDSVRAQTDVDWECLVVDDSSTDHTRAVVDDYHAQDARFRYVRHDSVPGSRDEKVVAVRQFAQTLGDGNFLAFLDDDDLWLPEYLEAVARPLRDNPRYVLAAAARLFWDGENILETQRFTVAQMEDPLRAVIRHCIIVPSQCLIRRSAFDRTPGFRLLGSEDYDLWLQIMSLGDGVFLNRPLVKYRVHAGSSLLDPTGDKRRSLTQRHLEVLHNYLRRRDIPPYDRLLALGMVQRKHEFLLSLDMEDGKVPPSRLARLGKLLSLAPSALIRNPSLAKQYLTHR